MWSDPPATIEDTFCIFFCTDAGRGRLQELLADEANDERSIVPDLYGEAATFQLEGYLKPHLKAEAVATLGLDPADDPASWSASRGVSRARSSRRIRMGYSV